VLVVAGGVAAKVVHDGKKVPRLPNNCPHRVTKNTVIVIDQTERMALQTRGAIKARAMDYVRQHVEVDERVSVFAIKKDSRQRLEPLFSMCQPPSDGNRLTEGVKQIRTAYLETFVKPLEEAMAAPDGEETQSPIAEVITDLTLDEYLRGSTNTLLVFSDMLEHTDRFSLYNCSSPENVVEEYTYARIGSKERPTFNNVAVKISFIPRRPRHASAESREVLRCRDKLWTWFFGDNSGPNASLELDYLPGDPTSENAHE
jgi:hypothetical protein